jgi:hypothetical protein
MTVGFNTVFAKKNLIYFIVKNISPQKKSVNIFGLQIRYGDSADLLAIPEVSEADIRHSLIKGELYIKLNNFDIEVTDSNIDLVQFSDSQRTFLKEHGVSNGTDVGEASTLAYDDTKETPQIAETTVQTALDYLKRQLLRPTLQKVRVGLEKKNDVDFTSVAEAIDYAISQGASNEVPWEIVINPGLYIEPPMVLTEGIIVTSDQGIRLNEVTIEAENPNQDLFTISGTGTIYISGIKAVGVTDPLKALFRNDNGTSLLVMQGIGIRKCYNGIIISNGSTCLINNASFYIDDVGQNITNGIVVDGSSTYLATFNIQAFYLPGIISSYTTNPIQRVISAHNGANVHCIGIIANLVGVDHTPDVIFADTGASIRTFSCDFNGCENCYHIGSSGSNTTVSIQGATFVNNHKNILNESSSGVVLSNYLTDGLNSTIASGAEEIGIIQDSVSKLTKLIGNVNLEYTKTNNSIDLPVYFNEDSSTGISSTCDVTDAGGLYVNISSGHGWISRLAPYNDAYLATWEAVTNLLLQANSTNYVYYSQSTNSIKTSIIPIGQYDILLATVITGTNSIRYLHNTRIIVNNSSKKLNDYLLSTRKVAWSTGLACYAGSTSSKIKVDPGSYYIGINLLSVIGSNGADATFSYYYGTDGYYEQASQTSINLTQYDNTGTLTTLNDGYFRTDTVYVTSDNRINVMLGTKQSSSAVLAGVVGEVTMPSFISPTACPLARLIVQKNVGVVSVIDDRPIPGINIPSGTSGVTSHSGLSGLANDDHKQYLLINGFRAMSGDLNVGNNNIINSGSINNVNITEHASRHDPGGLDALATGVPVNVLLGDTPSSGSASSYSLSDHQHGISSGVPVTISTANSSGTSSSVARADHIHAHGNQTDGYLHALVVANGSNGFMSGVDKSKLDNILTNSSPINVSKSTSVIGIATNAARADHKHDIDTAVPVITGTSNAEGTSTSLARADHVHIAAPPSYSVDGSTTITTTSLTDVLMTGMTLTPPAGTYLVSFTGDLSHNANGGTIATSIYYNGSKIAASQRDYARGSQPATTSFHSVTRITVNGSSAIEGRWRTNSATASNYHRTLFVLRVS